MTKTFIQYINQIHKELWNKSEDETISPDEIKKTIKRIAGATVVKKYWEGLHDFDRIEQIPEEQKWIVKQPEKAGINLDNEGDMKQKQVAIPLDVAKAGEQYGIDFSAVMTEAVIEEVSNKENFVTDYLGEDYNEKEADYIFSMIKNDLHEKKGDRQQMARRDRQRRSIYQDIFNVDTVRADEIDHIEELRKQAFKLKETL